jgi:hypothetical protein
MNKHLLVTLLAILLTCGAAFADPDGAARDASGNGKALNVRSFSFKFKDADKAAATIKPLMSAEGSISIQPGSNSLVVTDHSENLAKIAGALTRYDSPAQAFKLVVRLVSAGRVDAASAKVPDQLKDIAPKLAMLRFNSLEDLGNVDVEGKEGEPGVIDLPSGYRADFHFGEYDPSSDSIKVNDLHVSRLSGAQKDQLTSLLKTSLNLKIGQTVILGASKVPESQRALMIVLLAKR